MGEIVTAEAADGSVKVQSPQETPKQKSDGDRDSESSAPKAKRKSPVTSKASDSQGVELGHQGRVKSQWDNPAQDPNLRKHIGESPNGEGNEID